MKNKKISQKRGQIDKNQATTFAFVAIAAVFTVASLVISKGIWDRTRYMAKVVEKKEIAVKQLNDNKDAVSKLGETYKSFNSQNPNLLGGSIEGPGDKDGSNSTLVLDSLPNKFDFPALASSLEKMLLGYSTGSIGGTDSNTTDAPASPSSGAMEIPFTFDATTDYTGLKELISSFNRSIRPFHITKVELSGTNNELKANFTAKTFYQPDTTLKITTETVE